MRQWIAEAAMAVEIFGDDVLEEHARRQRMSADELSDEIVAPERGIPAKVAGEITPGPNIMIGIEIAPGGQVITAGNTVWLPIDRHLAEDLGLVRTVKVVLVPRPTP